MSSLTASFDTAARVRRELSVQTPIHKLRTHIKEWLARACEEAIMAIAKRL